MRKVRDAAAAPTAPAPLAHHVRPPPSRFHLLSSPLSLPLHLSPYPTSLSLSPRFPFSLPPAHPFFRAPSHTVPSSHPLPSSHLPLPSLTSTYKHYTLRHRHTRRTQTKTHKPRHTKTEAHEKLPNLDTTKTTETLARTCTLPYSLTRTRASLFVSVSV